MKYFLITVWRFRVGQNLYQGAVARTAGGQSEPDWAGAVAGWYSEVELFRQDPTKYDGSYRGTGHFTQIVWSRTR